MSILKWLVRVNWVQVAGAILFAVGVVRLLDARWLNGATWLLLGISLLVFKYPIEPDGHVRWGPRSIIGYAAMVAAFVLMLAHVILN